MIALALSMALAAALEAPPQCHVQLMVVRVPSGFAAEAGLVTEGAGKEGEWTLNPREARMLHAAFRAALVRDRANHDVLARPQLVLINDQKGFFQVGQEAPSDGQVIYSPYSMGIRLTPKFAAESPHVGLQLEWRVANSHDGVRDVQTDRTKASLPFGHTLVVRGAREKLAGGQATDMLLIATVTRVAPPPAR